MRNEKRQTPTWLERALRAGPPRASMRTPDDANPAALADALDGGLGLAVQVDEQLGEHQFAQDDFPCRPAAPDRIAYGRRISAVRIDATLQCLL